MVHYIWGDLHQHKYTLPVEEAGGNNEQDDCSHTATEHTHLIQTFIMYLELNIKSVRQTHSVQVQGHQFTAEAGTDTHTHTLDKRKILQVNIYERQKYIIFWMGENFTCCVNLILEVTDPVTE